VTILHQLTLLALKSRGLTMTGLVHSYVSTLVRCFALPGYCLADILLLYRVTD